MDMRNSTRKQPQQVTGEGNQIDKSQTSVQSSPKLVGTFLLSFSGQLRTIRQLRKTSKTC